MSNNHHVIEQIISSADIVKIIGKHVELKRSGNEFKGCCPFHNEKSPSFFVSPSKGVYNCFGCGVAGNALTFLKEYENMTAGEALKELSRQTGIELPKEPIDRNLLYKKVKPAQPTKPKTLPPKPQQSAPTATTAPNANQNASQNSHQTTIQNNSQTENSPITDVDFAEIGNGNEQDFYFDAYDTGYPAFEGSIAYDDIVPFEPFEPEQTANTTGTLYELLEKVSAFYRQQLKQNPSALQYFYQRGLNDNTMATFELGYAPSDWQHLEKAFPEDIDGLKKLFLVRDSERGGRTYCFLRERVIFPIKDNQGRVIGFGGRAMSDDVQPKYLNSKESPVFKKGMHLYGMYEGRKAKATDWLLVEGYMDVISLYQAGVYGAVAAMGTAIDTPQIEKLLQLNPTLTLCLDGDTAGQRATWRTMEVSLPALSDSKELRFLTLPQNHDPDTFVKAFGGVAMRQQIAHAQPLSQYLFSILSRRYDISIAEGRGKLLAEVRQLTKKLPKGSYGWLLREDMQAKMGLGKRQQAKAAQDALLTYDSEMTPQLMLQLCFLYQPDVLGAYLIENKQNNLVTRLNPRLIEDIFYFSKADQLPLLTKKPKQFNTLTADVPLATTENQPPLQDNPPKPSFSVPLLWEDVADTSLFVLVDWIQQIYPNLEQFSQPLAESYAEFEVINAKAHYILAGLSPAYQAQILSKWQTFFNELQQRQVYDISDLVTEIMIKLVMDGLDKKIVTANGLHKKQWLRKQHQAIKDWQQAWFEQKEVS